MPDPYKTQGSQIIGEYRLGRKLGGGGFGSVYLAEHVHEHTQVAIKILQVPLIKPEDLRDFIKEAGTMTLLRHPHIIPLLYFNLSSEGFPFLVMEYAPQGTLRDRHPKGTQVRLASIVEYVDQISSALQYAHDHRIIHRDVKPENMLLRADGTLLLSDFGIAKLLEQSTLMSVQTQIGTPVYMAPEQHMGHPCFASDQYALAVVVYEWISGTRPFQGTSFGLAVQHMTAPPSSLLNLLPTLPPPIEQVIFKALAKTPEQRFATMQEFASAFRAAVLAANFSGIYPKTVTADENPPQEEDMSELPITSTSKHTESEINISSTPQLTPTDQPLRTDSEAYTPSAPQLPLTDRPIEPDPQINTPSLPQLPITDQPITHDTPIGQAPDQINNPPSSHPMPAPSPVVAIGKSSEVVKALRRSSPLKRNLFILGSGLLIGFIILALVFNRVGVNSPPNQQANGNQSHTLSTSHSTLTAAVLNTNTVSGLIKKWAFKTGGRVESSPAVVGRVVYFGSTDNNVYALDAQSGLKKWVFHTQGTIVSSPAIADGIVYIGSDDKKLYAIDAQSGLKKWAFLTGGSVSAPPTVANGIVYVGSQDGNVYAIDAQSGLKKWAFHTESSAASSPGPPGPQGPRPRPSTPTVADGILYISTTDSNVYAIDAQSGLQKWAFHTESSVSSTPAVVDRVVYVGSQDGNVYAINAQSGLKMWSFQTGNSVASPPNGAPPPPIASSPAVVGGVVYIGSEDKNVYAIDAQSGKQKWAFQTGFFVVSSPAVRDGVVYVGSFDKNLYAIDAQSGLKKWAFATEDVIHSSPTVVDGMVHVGSFDSNLYAFGLPTKS